MTVMPFICLGIGFLTGFKVTSPRFFKISDLTVTVVLIVLMTTIGMNIGTSRDVMSNLGAIGVNCVVISLSAIVFSVLCVVIIERTLLPLERVQNELRRDKIDIRDEVDTGQEEEKKTSPLIFIMPVSIVLGVLAGYYVFPQDRTGVLDKLLIGSLVFLYIGVGISIGSNRQVFKYLKLLGFKILLLPAAILVGSLLGGFFSGLALGVSPQISVMSASGMSYYSLTGAYMTNAYGIATGTYGFVVNVMREFFTVLILPLLIRISKGSPIAGGAAGNMDTMLMPITRFVGPELGLVTLITGTILTFVVPFLLPLLHGLL